MIDELENQLKEPPESNDSSNEEFKSAKAGRRKKS